MSQAYDNDKGAAVLIDPLTEPEPSQETGLGTHFYPPDTKVPKVAASPSSPSSSTNPFRKGSIDTKTHSRQTSRDFNQAPPPGGSSKPFPKYREAAFGDLNETRRRSGSGDHNLPNYNQTAGEGPSRRRGSSLKERYPGDTSHKPLDIIRRDSQKAHRSPHLNKRHIPGADTVDRLDASVVGKPYHHEGPYDAALLARNTNVKHSPVAAVADSNREALKATPAENIKDALERHVPITGVASVPPGERDQLGRVYHYEEGTELMRDPNAPGGPYKQWPGVDYAKDDMEGKGEPTHSLDRALQNHSIHEREFDGQRGIELSDRPMMSDYNNNRNNGNGKVHFDARDPVEIAGGEGRYADLQHDVNPEAHISGSSDAHSSTQAHQARTSSLKKVGEGLKKRLSVKQKYREIHDGAVPE